MTIDPGQAFGTGAHHSTRLALECIDAIARTGAPACVLDVGTGSGVLALSAVVLGAQRAVGFDLDPLAAPAAQAAARINGVEQQVSFFTGPLEAVREETFDLVVANLLRSELLPLVAPLGPRVAPGGALVLSGLLEGDGREIVDAFSAFELFESSRRVRRDADGETWLGLTLMRPGPRGTGERVIGPEPERASPAPGPRPSH